jgi:hypothetical protein
MIVISHRGLWRKHDEKNSLEAFHRSFSLGFGIETDLRDRNGELVISHDMAKDEAIPAELFFSIYSKYAQDSIMALNIKSDGLQMLLLEFLTLYGIKNYFVFDMSTPDMISYINSGIRVFTRQSEYELDPVLYSRSEGVWMDCFNQDWIDEQIIEAHFNNGKKVCIVSPELHKRDFYNFWKKLKNMSISGSLDLMLCTDYPEDAREFFDEQN